MTLLLVAEGFTNHSQICKHFIANNNTHILQLCVYEAVCLLLKQKHSWGGARQLLTNSCGTWPNTIMSELYLRWRGWSVGWTTWWSWILTSAAAVALNKLSEQRHTWSDEIEGHNIIHTGEWSSALSAPSPLLSPCLLTITQSVIYSTIYIYLHLLIIFHWNCQGKFVRRM